MIETPTITVAYGDSHAPEVMEAVLTILREAGANLRVETIEIGSRIYAMDSKTGILPGAWQVLARTGVLLMAPVLTPDDKKCTETGAIIRGKMGLSETDPLVFIHPINAEVTARAYVCEKFALFEPVYNEQTLLPKNKSDPSPMLHAAIMMLTHLGQHDMAEKIHNAWLVAMEDGFGKKKGKKLQKLTEAIIARLGKRPATLPAAEYKAEHTFEKAAGH